jgi:hypothetical protein
MILDWDKTYKNLQKLVGKKLKSISGKADITLLELDEQQITIGAKTKSGKSKVVRRSTAKLRDYISKIVLNEPVHADVAVHGGGSSRSHVETLLANMPDVECTKIQNRKHIVWVGKATHKLGTLKQQAPDQEGAEKE